FDDETERTASPRQQVFILPAPALPDRFVSEVEMQSMRPSGDRTACVDQAIVLQEMARGAVSYARAVRTRAREVVAASEVVSAQCRLIVAEARRLRGAHRSGC